MENGSIIKGTSDIVGELFSVAAAGSALLDGTVSHDLAFDVPVGAHVISISATDAAGNASSAYSFDVTYVAPSISGIRMTESSPLTIEVRGTADATVHLVVADGTEADLALGSIGSGEAEFDVPDGIYDITGVATDRRGSASEPMTLHIVLDTQKPRLIVKVLKKPAAEGKLKLRVRAEEGSKVRVEVKKIKLAKRFRAGSAPREIARAVGDGNVKIWVSAQDSSGNQTVRRVVANISS